MVSFLFGLKDIGRILNTGMREIVFSISSLIYQIVIMFYEIFEALCGSRLFDNNLLQTFIDRISVILGIVMLFIVIFSFIKMLVDPDKINDKEFGATSIIKKVIVVIIMLGMSSFAFNALYYVQDVVIEEDIISKILLPMRIDEENSDKFGYVLASGLFMSFYQLDEEVVEKAGETDDVTYCKNITNQLGNQIMSNGNFSLGRECLTQTEKIEIDGENVETFVVDYNYLLSLITGCVVGYLLFSYCISVGIRMIQLLFLEIISPMAIVSYLMPKKDTMLGKWCKIYISTYVDVFIRIAIIDFIVFIIASIFTKSNVIFNLNNFTGFSKSVVLAIIVIALLTFAKKAPDLLKELFPGGASKLGFGPSTSGFAGIGALFGGLAGGAIGAVGGIAASGKAIGLLKKGWNNEKGFAENLKANKKNLAALGAGVLGVTGIPGLVRGGYAGKGSKGIGAGLKAGQQAQAKANVASAQRVASGLSYGDYIADKAKGVVGITNSYDSVDKESAKLQRVISAISGAPSSKMAAEQKESILQQIAVDKGKTDSAYYQQLFELGIDVSKKDNILSSKEASDYYELNNKSNRTADENALMLRLREQLQNKFGESQVINIQQAFDLKNQQDSLLATYALRSSKAEQLADDMQEAVFYRAFADPTADGGKGNDAHKALMQIEGVKYEDGKYTFNGMKITDWESIKAEIEEYNKNNGTNYTTLADFKKAFGKVSPEVVKNANRKTGK